MNKEQFYKIEEIGNKAETLSGLILMSEQTFSAGNFEYSNFEMAMAHITLIAKEVSNELNELIKNTKIKG